ncbi:MAG: hypothetical protein IPL49_10755 [Saprospirales bacterium]|nr:hypothetical protein [Saprospirales bacterium]
MKKIYLLCTLAFGGFYEVALAQSVCDLVTIQDIRYDAFRDTVLLVEVANGSPDIFSYPGFILYDTNGDTIAKEVVNFFGIGQYHISAMNIYPDAAIPPGIFEGTLELWTGFYDSLACTFDISEPLCPDTVCHTLVFDLTNFGGALVNASYTYSITDALGIVQVSKDFSLEDTVQQYQDTLCLPSGDYSLSIHTDDNPTGGQPYYGLYEAQSQFWSSQLSGTVDQGTATMQLPFSLYTQCGDEINAVSEVNPENPITLTWGPEGIWAHTSQGQIQELVLYDLTGRRIASRSGSGQELFLPAGDLRGFFMVCGFTDTGA